METELFARYQPGLPRRPATSAVVRRAWADDLPACARLAAARNGGRPTEWIARLGAHLSAQGAVLVAVAGPDAADIVGYGRVAWWAAPPGSPGRVAPTGYYLMGLLVDEPWRRRGLGKQLTVTRLAWVWERAAECWFFANARNRPSLDLHAKLGFREVTRDFTFPGVTFAGGEGVLGRAVRPGEAS